MRATDYDAIANQLRNAGITWSGVNGIEAAEVKLTIKRLVEIGKEAALNEPDGVTVESGGILVKVYPNDARVYVTVGEYSE